MLGVQQCVAQQRCDLACGSLTLADRQWPEVRFAKMELSETASSNSRPASVNLGVDPSTGLRVQGIPQRHSRSEAATGMCGFRRCPREGKRRAHCASCYLPALTTLDAVNSSVESLFGCPSNLANSRCFYKRNSGKRARAPSPNEMFRMHEHDWDIPESAP